MKASELIEIMSSYQDRFGDFNICIINNDNIAMVGKEDLKLMQTSSHEKLNLSLCIEIAICNEVLTCGF